MGTRDIYLTIRKLTFSLKYYNINGNMIQISDIYDIYIYIFYLIKILKSIIIELTNLRRFKLKKSENKEKT